MLTISIIVCTCNRETSLRRTLNSISQCTWPATEFDVELLVVDNGSSDQTKETVASTPACKYSVRYIWEPRRGKGYAYNSGLDASKGEILLLTDDDVEVPLDWVTRMASPIASGDFEAVAGGVVLGPELERPWLRRDLRNALASTDGFPANSPPTLVGANMAFSRRVLERVCQFDPELGPGALGLYDESLFTYQLKKAGYKVGTAFDVAVQHHCDVSRLKRRAFLENARKAGRSMAYVLHHWSHGRRRYIGLRLSLAYTKLYGLRLLRAKDWIARNGCAEWEMSLSAQIAFLQQLAVERCRPRNYEHEGLLKISGLLDRRSA